MIKEEGHYTLKRVETLPKKGNANLLYALKSNVLDKLYRWLPNNTYETITVGSTSITEPEDSRPYKVYTALLSQAGENDPTVIVLENNLGGDIIWTRDSIGTYFGTLLGAFIENKTSVDFSNSDNTSNYEVVRDSEDTIYLGIANPFTGTPTDTGFTNSKIEIRVYD